MIKRVHLAGRQGRTTHGVKVSLIAPWGVAIEDTGGLVIAGTGNHRIPVVSG